MSNRLPPVGVKVSQTEEAVFFFSAYDKERIEQELTCTAIYLLKSEFSRSAYKSITLSIHGQLIHGDLPNARAPD